MGLFVGNFLALQHIPVLELLKTAVGSLHWNKYYWFIFLKEIDSHSEQFMILALFLFSQKCKMASSKIWIKKNWCVYIGKNVFIYHCVLPFFLFFSPHNLELAQDLPFLNQKKIWCTEDTLPVSWNWHFFIICIIKIEKTKQTKKGSKTQKRLQNPKNPNIIEGL